MAINPKRKLSARAFCRQIHQADRSKTEKNVDFSVMCFILKFILCNFVS